MLAIGRDIYCDTLCILSSLEALFPSSALRASTPTDTALERLLEKWTDVVVFRPAADAIPSALPLCSDPAFIRDRTELWGRDWEPSAQDKLRPAGLANLQANFEFLEELLRDGREWVLGGKGPMLADIHGESDDLCESVVGICVRARSADEWQPPAAWIFGWMRSLPDGLPDAYFSRKRYPKTGAWLDRYEEAVQAAKDAAKSSTTTLSSEDALSQILSASSFVDDACEVLDNPIGVKKGQQVEVAPIDTGFNHRDVGTLVGLNTQEVVIEKASEKDGKPVRVHFPRWNFSVVPAGQTDGHLN